MSQQCVHNHDARIVLCRYISGQFDGLGRGFVAVPGVHDLIGSDVDGILFRYRLNSFGRSDQNALVGEGGEGSPNRRVEFEVAFFGDAR